MKFSEKIKKIRVDNNLTQEEMANKLFVSRSLIAKWEQDRGIPSIDMLNTIAATFGLTINDLISEDEIKLITIKNNQEVQTNKKSLKLSIIIGVVSILVLLVTIIFIIIKINLNNDIKPVFIELGLQTSNENTAKYIRRGYPNKAFEKCMELIHSYNRKITHPHNQLHVVVHTIIGLPNETITDMENTIRYINDFPIHGIKLQLLHVIEHTDLAKEYQKNTFSKCR